MICHSRNYTVVFNTRTFVSRYKGVGEIDKYTCIWSRLSKFYVLAIPCERITHGRMHAIYLRGIINWTVIVHYSDIHIISNDIGGYNLPRTL